MQAFKRSCFGQPPRKNHSEPAAGNPIHFEGQMPRMRKREGNDASEMPVCAASWHWHCHVQPRTAGSTRLGTAARIQHRICYSHRRKAMSRLLSEKRNECIIDTGILLCAGVLPHQLWAGALEMQRKQELQLCVRNIWQLKANHKKMQSQTDSL